MVARRQSERATSAAGPDAASSAADASSTSPHHLVLEGTEGKWKGTLWAIPREKTEAHVGRTKTAPISIKEGTVSEKHALFAWDASAKCWTVQDTESSNGSKLNGTDMEPGIVHPLRDGDMVQFGPEVFLQVHCRPAIKAGITVADLLLEDCEFRIQQLKERVGAMEAGMQRDIKELESLEMRRSK